jgi:uncharacterized protein YndB with AHSA1/START domain
MSKPDFVYVTYIQTTPDKVWNALFDKELTKLYWGVHKNVSDWQPGSEWRHEDYETGQAHVTGKVLEIDAPRRLVLSWEHPGSGEPPSQVTFLVEPFMDAVRLTVIHDQLSPKLEKPVTSGWPAILSSLKSLLESGQPMPMTTRRWSGPPK